MERAERSCQAFALLFENGLLSDAVSPLYYYLLHHVRALLLRKGLEPKSRQAVLRLFGQYYVREGTFPTEASHLFARMMKYREEADYNPSYAFTREDVAKFKEEATELAGRIKAQLEEAGHLEA